MSAHAEKRTSARDTSQQQLAGLIESTRSEISDLVDALSAGIIDSEDFESHMDDRLTTAHAQAAYLGRLRAGDTAPFDQDDRFYGSAVMEQESEYLARFQAALMEGRYVGADGLLDVDAVRRRALSYTGRIEGTANETWVLAAPPEAQFTWMMGGAEEHCDRCPELAAGSPYTLATLPTHPRANDTPCLWHCRCQLKRDDGETSFAAVDA